MADAKTMLDAILAVAKAAAPIVGNGAPEVVELGERLVELIDHAVDEFSGNPIPDELIDKRDELEEAVNAHVDQTVKKLRGK